MTHLKKCPYCNSDTRINHWKKKVTKTSPTRIETASIKCKRQTCGMSGPHFKGMDCKKRAANHWNNCFFENTYASGTLALPHQAEG